MHIFIMKCDNFVFQLQVLIIQITKLIFLNIGSYKFKQREILYRMPIISFDPCGKMCLENKELIPGAATLYR